MKVMLDAVFNHLGDQSMQWQDVVENGEKSRFKDWFHINSYPVEPYRDPSKGSGATVESIDPITIAFPNATDVTVEMAEDEILLMAQDQSWAATAISVSKVEDAPCPTFKFAATPTPTALPIP